jgi:hypothetical protein
MGILPKNKIRACGALFFGIIYIKNLSKKKSKKKIPSKMTFKNDLQKKKCILGLQS